MVFLCIACIVLSSIALHGIALHRIAWHCMVLQRLHGVVQLIWRAGELPRSASSHFLNIFLLSKHNQKHEVLTEWPSICAGEILQTIKCQLKAKGNINLVKFI